MWAGSARRIAVAVVLAVLGGTLVIFALFLYRQGLDRADQWSSVIAGFAGLAGLIASATSLLTHRRDPAAVKPALVPVRGAWGLYRLPAATAAVLAGQARAVRSAPYRVTGIDNVPLATMYVRQQLEVHRSGAAAVESQPPTIDRMGVRSRPVSGTKVLPLSQKVEHVLGKHRHLIIEGGPGLGKSSLARHLTLHLAQAWFHPDSGQPPTTEPVVPLLVTARALARHRGKPWLVSLAHACSEELGQHADDPVPVAALSILPSGVRWMVIVDGLDEVADEPRHELIEVLAERMAEPNPPVRLVVLSRPLPDAGWRRLASDEAGVYSLLPFSRAALRDFAEGALVALRPHDADVQTNRFLDQLRTGDLDEVARVPLLATIAVTVFAADPLKGLPRTRYELYEQYIAHLTDAGRRRRNEVRVRLRRRITDTAGPRSSAAVDQLFDRVQELIEHVAVCQVETSDLLSEAAAEWCRRNQLWLRTASWPEVVAEVLISTGLLIRRDGDIRFIHHSFAEHAAADHQAGRLPADFDPASPQWRDWIRRATDDDATGLAVLLRWVRRYPCGALLDWLQQGSGNFQWVALELLANGAAGTPAQISASLSYVERRAPFPGAEDWLLKPASRLARDETVRAWAARVLQDHVATPQLHAVAARMLSDAPSLERQLAIETIDRRLGEELLPWQRLALAGTAVVLHGASHPLVRDQYHVVLTDPRAIPAERLTAGQALIDLGRDRLGPTVQLLSEMMVQAAPADAAASARVLADVVPERRQQCVAVVRSAAEASGLSDEDRQLIAKVQAELDVDETSGGADMLRALAADLSLDPGLRSQAAMVLADLGQRHRHWAADVLEDIGADASLEPWHRGWVIRQLGLLGPDHRAASGRHRRCSPNGRCFSSRSCPAIGSKRHEAPPTRPLR